MVTAFLATSSDTQKAIATSTASTSTGLFPLSKDNAIQWTNLPGDRHALRINTGTLTTAQLTTVENLMATALTTVLLDFGRAGVSMQIDAPLDQFELGFKHPVADAPLRTVARYRTELPRYILAHVRPVAPDGRPWRVTVEAMAIEPATDASPIDIRALLRLTPPPGCRVAQGRIIASAAPSRKRRAGRRVVARRSSKGTIPMAQQRYRPPVDFGLGGVAIGNEFQFATDEQAEATLAAAWDAGVRYFDVSPWYGLGLAERRFGRFLARKPRGEFTLSSKVGKLLKASRDNEAKTHFPFTTSPNTPHFDYTADGVRRSIEDSLQRLGLDRLDIVFVHDLSPDNLLLPDDWEALFKVAEAGAFPELTRMRAEGLIDGWGMGVNCPQPILRCLEVADSDVHLLASQYSLVDHANAVEQVFPAARAKGVSFVVGSSLNAGFLGGEGRYNYGKDDTLIARHALETRRRLRTIAEAHGVDLVAASLQFSLAPDVASALIVGAATPEHILADHAAMQAKIPDAFWKELRAEGILHPDAALPIAPD